MITYSIRARMARVGPEAATWAHQVADHVTKKTGVPTQVSSRIGGPQDIIWVTNYEDFGAFEKAQAALQSDQGYLGMLATAEEKHLFDTATVESAFWQPI